MRILKFTDSSSEPKVAILIKESSFDEYDLRRYYVDPLVAKGIAPENIVACSLEYFQEKLLHPSLKIGLVLGYLVLEIAELLIFYVQTLLTLKH